MQHVTIYREPGRYAGWPANYGMWSWGNEIVVIFTVGYHDQTGQFHARDTSKPFSTVQARSRDGGYHWEMASFPGRTPGNRAISADEHMKADLGVGAILDLDSTMLESANAINFAHPDFAMLCAKTGLSAGVRSFFYTSYDRCYSWNGPYCLPMFGQTGIAARTDYVIEDGETCTLFITANKRNGQEGRVFCARTHDRGKSFDFVSYVGKEPEGVDDFAIMPASVRLDDRRLLVAVRCRGGNRKTFQDQSWIDLYCSEDNAESWHHLSRPNSFHDHRHSGNPATLDLLPDGRVCLIYGNRDIPYSISARISDDKGKTWGEEITLRDQGGNHDIGYPRTVVQPDGTIITAYYFNDHPDGERFIEATIWKP